MYYPSSRLLSVLDLLRTNGQMTASALAEHLEVDPRTVRRYVVMLEDLGMPVETIRGRGGGYRLRPGYMLPPIAFSDEEASILALGLQFVRRLGLTGSRQSTEIAIAKLQRAMPERLQTHVRMMSESLSMHIRLPTVSISSEMAMILSRSVYDEQRVRICYRASSQTTSERDVDPYGIVYTIGYWYLVGYCHLRQDRRTFRIDRILAVKSLNQTFTRPENFDPLTYAEESIARKPWIWATKVLLKTSLEEAKRKIPAVAAVLEPVKEGVEMTTYVDDLGEFARFLLGLKCQLEICSPPELRNELRCLAQRAIHLANDSNNG